MLDSLYATVLAVQGEDIGIDFVFVAEKTLTRLLLVLGQIDNLVHSPKRQQPTCRFTATHSLTKQHINHNHVELIEDKPVRARISIGQKVRRRHRHPLSQVQDLAMNADQGGGAKAAVQQH